MGHYAVVLDGGRSSGDVPAVPPRHRPTTRPETDETADAPGAGPDAGAPPAALTAAAALFPDDPTLPEYCTEALDSEQAQLRLRVLDEQHVRGCTRCGLHAGRRQTVFGVGNPRAELVFVGEGPGAEEDEQGLPFVGRAGQLLTRMIEAMGLTREQVYICNVVKCRPPGNRTPTDEEMQACTPFLLRQLAIIRPRVIVALGRPAAQTLLGTRLPIGQLRGRLYDFPPPPLRHLPLRPARLMPTFHPAYLLRNPAEKGKAWEDLKQVMKYLGLPPPRRGSRGQHR